MVVGACTHSKSSARQALASGVDVAG